ncbi:glycosyltransferase family 2 protein [Microbulbifer sp. SAOS-129_SWC]|uniref:glycosyltransferase family 2 protein n=1 Tax=Microbulbifer sp. SAOS-129_SWC TaxID=3145235 RepID=UPI0032180424
MLYRNFKVALAVPCFNEEKAIRQVINDFRDAMPALDIYVFDNRSDDRTGEVAKAEGAKVISVEAPGKGSVVRRMFADVDADILVMVDGDATYVAHTVTAMVDKLIDERLDMVVGCRSTPKDSIEAAYRPGHKFGNRLLTASVKRIFGGAFSDMLSGYRVFSRRYVKSFPASSQGFEIETELTIHALELRMPWGESPVQYGARPAGTESKLSTYRDGWRILRTIVHLYIAERPLSFYSLCAFLIAALSIGISVPVIMAYIDTGLVERFPTAILSASMMICALLSLACGLVLDNVTRGRQEIKRMAYLAIPHPTS